MAKKKATALATISEFKIDTNIDVSNDDVVSVAVAQHDLNLEVAMKETKSHLKVLQEAMKKVREDLSLACAKMAEVKMLPSAVRVTEALTKEGFVTGKLKAVTAGCIIKETVDNVSVPKLKASASIKVATGGYSRDLIKEKVFALTAPIKKLVKHEEELGDIMVKTKERQVVITQEQGNLHRVEVRARAQLAKATLSTSAGGRDVLKQIESVTLPALPALPAYKARK